MLDKYNNYAYNIIGKNIYGGIFMKKRLQGLIAGVLIGAMLTSGAVIAKQISETAELFYNNIKIYITAEKLCQKMLMVM